MPKLLPVLARLKQTGHVLPQAHFGHQSNEFLQRSSQDQRGLQIYGARRRRRTHRLSYIWVRGQQRFRVGVGGCGGGVLCVWIAFRNMQASLDEQRLLVPAPPLEPHGALRAAGQQRRLQPSSRWLRETCLCCGFERSLDYDVAARQREVCFASPCWRIRDCFRRRWLAGATVPNHLDQSGPGGEEQHEPPP